MTSPATKKLLCTVDPATGISNEQRLQHGRWMFSFAAETYDPGTTFTVEMKPTGLPNAAWEPIRDGLTDADLQRDEPGQSFQQAHAQIDVRVVASNVGSTSGLMMLFSWIGE